MFEDYKMEGIDFDDIEAVTDQEFETEFDEGTIKL